MNFYSKQHAFYCGVDLHARTLYLCILSQAGDKLLHRELPAEPVAFLDAVAPYRQDLVVAAECMFAWYWLADLCAQEKVAFVLGHALYMKAIHGGKSKNDRIDAEKIATLLRGGNLPQAYVYPKGLRETRDLLRRRMYVYPKGLRETRDLLRRRMHLVHRRGQAITHVVNTNSQYNLPPFGHKI